jgi:recombination protein RecA
MKKNDKAKKSAKANKEPTMAAPVIPPQALVVQGTSAIAEPKHDSEAAAFFGPSIEDSLGKGEKFDRGDQIAALMQSVNKQYKGGAIIRQGSDITNVFMLRRPSGIISLDLRIGGGAPAGGLTQIIGKYSAGKSTLANLIMAEVQRNYGNDFAGAACMTEQRYDKDYAKRRCGLRIAFSDAEIAVVRQSYRDQGYPDFDFTPEHIVWFKDQVGYFTETLGATAEQLLEVAVQQIESNLFQVILIDSFGALLTKAEAEAEEGLDQKHRGGSSMVITQFMHRLHAALNMPDRYGRPNTTTVLGINQARDNMGKDAQWNPLKAAGGNALAHGQLLNIHVEQGARIRQVVGKENRIVGKEINWEIMKGKAGCHDGPKGTYKFYYGQEGFGFGIDIYSDLLVAGLQTAVIQQSGAWYSYQEERLGQGEVNVARTLYSNPDLLQKIRRDIFKTAGLNFIVREHV